MRLRKPILLLLAAVLSIAALYALFRERPVPPPASPEFTLKELKGYGVENRHTGPLYVIEGTVANDMAAPRCRIQIKVSLLDANGQELAQALTEAGPSVSISELKFLGWDELTAKLAPDVSDPCRATLVAPGGETAFMAVFRKPPAGAATYSAVATGSQAPAPSAK
ncbi:DUF3426 domain-containing protein [Fundidesulfovibrio terrae]|uniref:DUF3426 domain-containing protein n=1 Tax=Fundidesulfovibrio terrae TaxID=2922866 RepID=UPI001FAF3CE3|nr:DUF3426 domain-containing protein [Fundidesulfovibrio terrae]